MAFFEDPSASVHKYLLVVNRSPDRSSRTWLTVSGRVRRIERFDPSLGASGAFVAATLTGTPPRRYLPVVLGPGRARLYRLRTV